MLDEILNAFRQGGWVMYPLLAISLVSLMLMTERGLYWARTNSRARRRFISDLVRRLQAGQREAATALAQSGSDLYSRFAAELLAGQPAVATEPVALDLIERTRPAIERFGTTLAVIVAAAPLLGILGTVTGIIQSFQLFGSEEPITDPGLIAAGIAQALYTTAYGLTIALITLLPHAHYRAQAERCLARLEVIAAATTAK